MRWALNRRRPQPWPVRELITPAWHRIRMPNVDAPAPSEPHPPVCNSGRRGRATFHAATGVGRRWIVILFVMNHVLLGHVELVTAETVGSDQIDWLAELYGLGGQPGTGWEEFALLCVVDRASEQRITYLCPDPKYAKMISAAHERGVPVELDPEVVRQQCPLHRYGWPGDWTGLAWQQDTRAE